MSLIQKIFFFKKMSSDMTVCHFTCYYQCQCNISFWKRNDLFICYIDHNGWWGTEFSKHSILCFQIILRELLSSGLFYPSGLLKNREKKKSLLKKLWAKVNTLYLSTTEPFLYGLPHPGRTVNWQPGRNRKVRGIPCDIIPSKECWFSFALRHDMLRAINLILLSAN